MATRAGRCGLKREQARWAAAIFFGALVTGPGAAAAATHTVVIEAMVFRPAALQVARGDRVVWVNRDLVPHTATATTGRFDSGRIEPDQQWSMVMEESGTFAYVCAYHPTMRGTLEAK
jgi:plastocyanin